MITTTGGGDTESPDRRALLIRFIEEVWNQGDVDAAARYIAPRYTVQHDPGAVPGRHWPGLPHMVQHLGYRGSLATGQDLDLLPWFQGARGHTAPEHASALACVCG